MTAVLGIDLALKNIAIILLEGGQHEVLFTTSKGPTRNLGKSIQFMQSCLVPVFLKYAGLPVAIDWSPQEAMMRTNRITVTHKSFLAGYLYRTLLSQGSSPVCISPNTIRKFLGVKQNRPKEDVWKVFLKTSGLPSQSLNSHERDALILAWILKQHLPLVENVGFEHGLL